MIRTLAPLLAAFLLSGCALSERPTVSLVLAGSRTMTPLMLDVAERFQESHPGVRVNVESTPGDRPIYDTRFGLADLGMLGRNLRPEESGLLNFPIARDGLAIIVNRNNPVKELSEAQIAGLFTRAYVNWRELGGADRPVLLAGQSEARAARGVFLAFFGLQELQVRANPTVAGNEQAIDAVANHPEAIGYASLGLARKAAANRPIRLLPLAGVPAKLENVANGRYPLVRPLQLLAREPPHGAVQEFLEFARSAAVHDLIEKHGFAPAIR
jgi:phosphate transport system substrate-binding protein